MHLRAVYMLAFKSLVGTTVSRATVPKHMHNYQFESLHGQEQTNAKLGSFLKAAQSAISKLHYFSSMPCWRGCPQPTDSNSQKEKNVTGGCRAVFS